MTPSGGSNTTLTLWQRLARFATDEQIGPLLLDIEDEPGANWGMVRVKCGRGVTTWGVTSNEAINHMADALVEDFGWQDDRTEAEDQR